MESAGDNVSEGVVISLDRIAQVATTVIQLAALIAALIAIVTYFTKVHNWFLHQQEQDKQIKELKEQQVRDIKEINEELTLLTYGVLACLKGLKEQGCDGPVTEAIDKIDKHINQKAHDQK